MPSVQRRRNLPAVRTAPLSHPSWTVLLPKQPARLPLLTMGIGALVAANLCLYVLTVVQEARLNHYQAEIHTMREHNVRLRAELASAESPDRVETAAINDLKMVRSGSSLFLPPLPPAAPAHARVAPPTFGAREAY